MISLLLYYYDHYDIQSQFILYKIYKYNYHILPRSDIIMILYVEYKIICKYILYINIKLC